MAVRKRKWWNIFGLLIDMFKNSVTESIPDEVKLESDARSMLAALNEMSNYVSLTMANADKKHNELTNKVAEYKSYDQQAKKFLSQNKEVEAQRCVTLKLQAGKEIETLKEDYKQLQDDAEQKLAHFQKEKRKVKEKMDKIPQLKNDAKMVRQQEELEEKFSDLSLDSPSASFDEVAGEIEMKKNQLRNKRMLTEDPNAQIDAEISQQLEQQNIDDEMNRLRKQIYSAEDADYEVVDDSGVDDAVKLLEKPRFSNSISGFNFPEKEKVRVKRNESDNNEEKEER